MTETKGTIKISENKIKLKIDGKVETYIKRQSIDSKSWITIKGEIYELEVVDLDDESED